MTSSTGLMTSRALAWCLAVVVVGLLQVGGAAESFNYHAGGPLATSPIGSSTLRRLLTIINGYQVWPLL